MSTGCARMNAAKYATVDTAIIGNNRTPNHPIYNLMIVHNKKLVTKPHQELLEYI
jgi:hypothetical protein